MCSFGAVPGPGVDPPPPRPLPAAFTPRFCASCRGMRSLSFRGAPPTLPMDLRPGATYSSASASVCAERLVDPRLDLADHQFHLANRRLVRRVADLERKAHMLGPGRVDLGDE